MVWRGSGVKMYDGVSAVGDRGKMGKVAGSATTSLKPSRRIGRISIYLYVLVMGLLFANQAWMSISKYLDKEVRERERHSIVAPMYY